MPQLSLAELVAMVVQLQSELSALRAENQRFKDRIAELDRKNPTQRLKESYSVKSEEQRRREAETKGEPGRKKHGSSGDKQ